MKKIYAAAALILAAFTGQAQTAPQVDLHAMPVITEYENLDPITGREISWYSIIYQTNPFDSIQGGIFIRTTGSGFGLDNGDQVFYATPTSTLSPTGGVFGYVRQISAPVDTGLIFAVDGNLDMTDSVNVLLNIENYEAGAGTWDSILVERPNLVVGQVYGFFAYATEWPQDGSATFQDTIRGNNLEYIPVIWGPGDPPTNIKGFSTKYESLDLYPNPANSRINYSFEVKKASTYQTVKIMDITGRTVKTENFGATQAGQYNGSLDVSALPAGNYSIMVITQFGVNTTKFVKK